MNSKALLVLTMLLASVLVISMAEVTHKEGMDEKLNKKDDNLETNAVEKTKYYGGPWRGPWGRGWCHLGCCAWGYYGGCRRCCFYPGEHIDAITNVEPRN
ncbi:Glycine rich protein [Sesbania bispinosa]|nr:Glycine rich protein [Sesbania bispinosa]